MERDATFSPCQQYRYSLRRCWNRALPLVLFVGLNPSTADAQRDDPTIRRCIQFARSWGYGGVLVGNVYAYRATDGRVLSTLPDPVGQDNDCWLQRLGQEAAVAIAAWGNRGAPRATPVRALLPTWHYLRLNRSGQPTHPLYLPAQLTPRPWT